MIAVHLTSAGLSTKANDVIRELSPEPDKDKEATREGGLLRFAIAQANARDGAAALQTLESVRDPRLAPTQQWQRSYALAISGNFAQATAIATQISLQDSPSETRWSAIRLVASVMSHSKGTTEATAWANTLPNPADRLSAFVGIADGLLAAPVEEVPPYFQD